MENKTKKSSFRLLAVITTPKLADKTAALFKKGALPLQYRFTATGTASNEIVDMLGLGGVDKCVLVSMVPKKLSGIILAKLHSELQLDTVNSGVAFTIPLNGANHFILRMLTQNSTEEPDGSCGRDENTMTDAIYVLIATIVNRGFSEDVMQAAKRGGAKGGTVIHSHRIGNEEVSNFWGLSTQDEKDIVLVLAPTENKINIMHCISEQCGLKTDAGGIVMSLPVDAVMGI